MHPLNCPSWEYSTHPQHAVIPFRVSEVLTALATGGIDTLLLATDTRDVHHRVFQQLTPINCDYYAAIIAASDFGVCNSIVLPFQVMRVSEWHQSRWLSELAK